LIAEIAFSFKPIVLIIPSVRRMVLRIGAAKYVLMDVDLTDTNNKVQESFNMFMVVCHGRITAYSMYIIHILCIYLGPNRVMFLNVNDLPYEQIRKTVIVAAVTVFAGIVQVLIAHFVTLRYYKFNIANCYLTAIQKYYSFFWLSICVGCVCVLASINRLSGFLWFRY